jgi:hypothetical protein
MMGYPRPRSGRQQGGCELLMPRGRRSFQAIDASMDGLPFACLQRPSNGRLGLADLPELCARRNAMLAREQGVCIALECEIRERFHGARVATGSDKNRCARLPVLLGSDNVV